MRRPRETYSSCRYIPYMPPLHCFVARFPADIPCNGRLGRPKMSPDHRRHTRTATTHRPRRWRFRQRNQYSSSPHCSADTCRWSSWCTSLPWLSKRSRAYNRRMPTRRLNRSSRFRLGNQCSSSLRCSLERFRPHSSYKPLPRRSRTIRGCNWRRSRSRRPTGIAPAGTSYTSPIR